MKQSMVILGITLMLAACGNASEAPARTFDRDAGAPENLPFSAAVIAGDTIYLSGQIGRKPGETALVEGGASAETKQIFENYKGILARNNSSLADIVKCTVFLEDMADYAAMNAAYSEAFPGDKPARSTLGADGLAFNAAVEIECIAVRGQE